MASIDYDKLHEETMQRFKGTLKMIEHLGRYVDKKNWQKAQKCRRRRR